MYFLRDWVGFISDEMQLRVKSAASENDSLA